MKPADMLLTMQKDLRRALSRDDGKRRWAMLIDTRRCIGCHACSVGCMAENVLPPACVYRPVFESEGGRYPAVRRLFVPKPCMHCDRPPCVGVCPKPGKATWKSREGVSAGMVLINYEECNRCGRCIKVCPYKARSRDEGIYFSERAPFVPKYEKRPSDEYGRKWSRDSGALPPGSARKCHFCIHRVTGGMLPACVTTCNGKATYFGDIDDPESLIATVKRTNTVATIKSVSGPDRATGRVVFGGSMTVPRVYYIL